MPAGRERTPRPLPPALNERPPAEVPAARRLTAATVFAAALFALTEPAAAQSGCELLYLQWEGCATECESYYENRVARAVCRAWCLVEYVHDYWTCESNVEASEGSDAPPAEEETREPDEERGASGTGRPRDPGDGRSPRFASGVVSGARRAVFRRAPELARRCGAPTSSAARTAAPPSPIPRPVTAGGA